ncbi:phospholipase A [Colwellia psychrerythraea]|uniref:Phospholipase A1 n=1 Tax=Colwellia psychrerythraea TaxID=28229 RepID=A0A099KZ29_COLPS|nr:phospholipase A [Colwellia psychrerythraea]KGJ95072.1 Phospholipase A(1) [Colwellia psychrerythraea]
MILLVLIRRYLLLLTFLFPLQVLAEDNGIGESAAKPHKKAFETCLFKAIKAADKTATLAEIETYCEQQIARSIINKNNGKTLELGVLANRVIREKRTAADPYVLTPHKMNYILPLSMVDEINREAYQGFSDWADELKDVEAKFQISLKVPLLTDSLFREGDQIFFGFTLQSWWQIYSEEISKPFRETNYQPEFFYFTPISFHPFGGNSALVVGAEHQSNGRSQILSRGWNRVYVNYLYEKRNFALSLRPWYRIPESEKKSPSDGQGDDNPDILDYMGYFELGMLYKYDSEYELSFMGRNNFATHKGFVEFGLTFPLWGKLKGYAQISSGYGESLIDYNVNQKRFGIGIALTNLL